MKIITNRKVLTKRTSNYSNACGCSGFDDYSNFSLFKKKSDTTTTTDADKSKIGKNIFSGIGKKDDNKTSVKKEKTGFFSKKSKEERNKKREKRKQDLKAKYGARPLKGFFKQGKQFFKDHLPKLKKKENGNYEKKNPDGTTLEINAKDTTTIQPPSSAPKNTPPVVIDNADLNSGGVTNTSVENGEVVITKTYTEAETETAIDDNGLEQVYKKSDTIEVGMSKTLKIGLIVGGSVILLGLIGLLIYKSKNNKGK
jgi:hypothetical protein